jgi:prephenate dehydrogenase
MTWVSHLPLAVASALARAVSSGAGTGLDRVAGPGLLDTTRVADTPAFLALELALSDAGALAAAIDAVRAELDRIARSLRSHDAEKLHAFFDDATKARQAFESSPYPPGRGAG